jgi:5-methylcytosine-specific restriction enzyme A
MPRGKTMLKEIKPTEPQRVMDLVGAAGVDISDWKNFKGENAAANPKYCYEWAFVEPHKVVVLNLWHEEMLEHNGSILQRINLRQSAKKLKPIWQRRAFKMDTAIKTAHRDALPIRIIVCDGKRRGDDGGSDPSIVERRLLDPIPWAIESYDMMTGACVIIRGGHHSPYVDQFTIQEEQNESVNRKEVIGLAFVRSPEVRKRVLSRAKGRCEKCAQQGFIMTNGSIYLETHHIIPLSEGGPDNERNVIALCPNHHREAHFGAGSDSMRKDFLEKFN